MSTLDGCIKETNKLRSCLTLEASRLWPQRGRYIQWDLNVLIDAVKPAVFLLKSDHMQKKISRLTQMIPKKHQPVR